MQDVGLEPIDDAARERWAKNLEQQKVPLDKHFKFGELRNATFRHCDLTGVTVEERNGNVISLVDLHLTKDKERIRDVLKGTICGTTTVKFSNDDDKQLEITKYIRATFPLKPGSPLKGSGLDLTGWNQPTEDLTKIELPKMLPPGKEKKEDQEIVHFIDDDESVDTADDSQPVADDFEDFKQRKYTSTQGEIPAKKKEKKGASEVDLAQAALPAMAGDSGS